MCEGTTPGRKRKDPRRQTSKAFSDSSIYAYAWEEYILVSEVDGDVVVSYDDSELDLEDYIIVKDGLQITASDLEKDDMIYFASAANDEDGFAVVYNKTVTGEITDVFSAEIRIDGTTYNYASATKYDKATQYLDGDSFEAVDSDVAEEFQAGGDVTLFLDHKGDAVYLTGAQEVVDSNDLGFHLTEDVVYYNASGAAGRGTLELEGVNGDGDEKVYTFRVDTLDTVTSAAGIKYEVGEAFSTLNSTEIDKFALSALSNAVIEALDEDGNVIGPVTTGLDALAQDNDFIEISTDDEGVINGLSFITPNAFSETTDALELDDKFIDGYKLMANTVVFDGSAGWDTTYKPDADDINVSTWGDLADEGFKVFEASYYVNDDNEVDYLVIKNSDAEDTTDYNAVVTKVLKNTDSEIVELTVWLDGVKKTYDVDEVKDSAVGKGSIVTLAVNDGDATMVEDIDVVTKQGVVSAVSVSERTVTVTGDNAGTYTLVSDGSVINSKDTGDILVKALRDIKIGDTVNLSLDEEVPATSKFVDVVNILSSGAETPPVVGGNITYINADTTVIEVEGVVYTLNAGTVLRNELGVIEYSGASAINGATLLVANTSRVFDIVSANGVISSFKYSAATADKVAAKTVIDEITALATSTHLATDVSAARGSYTALTQARKNLVTNLASLVSQETAIANAATEIADGQQVKTDIAAAANNLQVTTARADYEGLGVAGKAEVDNLAALVVKETALVEAKTALASKIVDATTLYNAQKTRLDSFTALEVSIIGAPLITYNAAVAALKTARDAAVTFDEAADAATAATIASATSTLNTAIGTLNTATDSFDLVVTVIATGK